MHILKRFLIVLSVVGVTIVAAAPSPAIGAGTSSTPAKPVYAMYYLWWSQQHWHDKLGPAYPYTLSPLPLPANLDADGCGPVSQYAGNQLVDVPQRLASYDQDDPKVVEQDVRNAARAGIRGFLANWSGTGDPNQTVTSSSYSMRLEYLVNATNKVNAEGIPFKLWISYKASAAMLSDAAIRGDLAYLVKQYGTSPAFDHSYSSRLMLIWQGSRKYGLSHIQTISNRYRTSVFFVGDENWRTWADGRANYLDGDSYYWSSQDPYNNPQSFAQLQRLASMVRGSPTNPDGSAKLWFAPLTPGYDNVLLGSSGSCVNRIAPDGTSTLAKLYNGNSVTHPDGWTLISWNEIAEGTFVLPLSRWGWRELSVLSRLIGGSV